MSQTGRSRRNGRDRRVLIPERQEAPAAVAVGASVTELARESR